MIHAIATNSQSYKRMANIRKKILLIWLSLIVVATCSSPSEDLRNALEQLRAQRHLRGVQVQVSRGRDTVFNLNMGEKNEKNQSVDSNTLFRVASLSKSFSSVALLQLAQQGKVRLNQTLTQLFGTVIQNPNFPGVGITVEMLLSHQSSLVECQPYYTRFIQGTFEAKTGADIPHIKQILLPSGKYYNPCMFSSKHQPGQPFEYVNLNFALAGTIVQLVSGERFDHYQQKHILTAISEGEEEVATFNPISIKNPNNLGVLYRGQEGKWMPTVDNHPSGEIPPERDMTGYVLGTNGIVFGPQGSLRASATHITNYAYMLANSGQTRTRKVVLSSDSARQMVKQRYQYHGSKGGPFIDYHLYSLGLYTTTYYSNDNVIAHEQITGHEGVAYGLVSAFYFWKGYILTYIVSGALYGYKQGTGTIYEYERMVITNAIDAFIKAQQTRILQTE